MKRDTRARVLPESARCDGITECFNAEDERDCGDRKQVTCVPEDPSQPLYVVIEDQICDGKQDCLHDAEDERDCPLSFLCTLSDGPGHRVIASSKVCDGTWDCYADEFDCPGVESFACSNGHTIPLVNECDQIAHCRDASDEDPEQCQQIRCAKGWSSWSAAPVPQTCGSCGPEYVPNDRVCDGVRNCLQGDDEEGC